MKEYKFEITEICKLVVWVVADSSKEAKKIVQDRLNNGDIMMDEGTCTWEIKNLL